VKKFEKMGLEATIDEIFSSAFAAAAYLSTMDGFVRKEGTTRKPHKVS